MSRAIGEHLASKLNPEIGKHLNKNLPLIFLLECLKKKMPTQYSQNIALWKSRPMTNEMKLYAACDVALVHSLYETLWPKMELKNDICIFTLT